MLAVEIWCSIVLVCLALPSSLCVWSKKYNVVPFAASFLALSTVEDREAIGPSDTRSLIVARQRLYKVLVFASHIVGYAHNSIFSGHPRCSTMF